METLDLLAYEEYEGLEISCLTQMSKYEWHGETECGLFIAIGIKGGILSISTSETFYDLGYEISMIAKSTMDVSKYDTNISQIIKYMNWKINKDNIWPD
jgi:hypothetical protein